MVSLATLGRMVMNSHGRPSKAAGGIKANALAAGLGHAGGAWPLSLNVAVVIISVDIILVNSSG